MRTFAVLAAMTAPADRVDLRWASDCCLRLDFGADEGAPTRARVHAATRALRAAPITGLVDLTPAFSTLLVTFAPDGLVPELAEAAVRAALPGDALPAPDARRVVEVPTCYEAGCAPDLDDVARRAGLPRDEVIALHSGTEFTVAFLGFAPGFPYLDGLPERLATPRLAQPRPRVPWGSVAIAGRQAGIYPHVTAGGWRLVGRTPLRLFDPERQPPALLQQGDAVRFVPITHAEHAARAAQPL